MPPWPAPRRTLGTGGGRCRTGPRKKVIAVIRRRALASLIAAPALWPVLRARAAEPARIGLPSFGSAPGGANPDPSSGFVEKEARPGLARIAVLRSTAELGPHAAPSS